MNDGHLAQEKLQERVNFGEKYLSMIQLYLVLADFWDKYLSMIQLYLVLADFCFWSDLVLLAEVRRRFVDDVISWSKRKSKIFSFLKFSLALDPTFDLSKQNTVNLAVEMPPLSGVFRKTFTN